MASRYQYRDKENEISSLSLPAHKQQHHVHKTTRQGTPNKQHKQQQQRIRYQFQTPPLKEKKIVHRLSNGNNNNGMKAGGSGLNKGSLFDKLNEPDLYDDDDEDGLSLHRQRQQDSKLDFLLSQTEELNKNGEEEEEDAELEVEIVPKYEAPLEDNDPLDGISMKEINLKKIYESPFHIPDVIDEIGIDEVLGKGLNRALGYGHGQGQGFDDFKLDFSDGFELGTPTSTITRSSMNDSNRSSCIMHSGTKKSCRGGGGGGDKNLLSRLVNSSSESESDSGSGSTSETEDILQLSSNNNANGDDDDENIFNVLCPVINVNELK